MARVGRFVGGGTGGSSLSSLIYNIMRSQYSRQVDAMVSAYKNGVSYMGEGIPDLDRVVSFLQEYSQKNWLSDYERQNIVERIKEVKTIENQRQGNMLVAAVNADPSNVEAVQNYISYLQDNIANADTPYEASQAREELYNAQGNLVTAIGNRLRDNLISESGYDEQVNNILSTYEQGSPQYQTLLTSAFESKYSALKFAEYTKVLKASKKGNAAYSKALNNYIDWIKSQRSKAIEIGVAGSNGSGSITSGSDGILQIERDLAEAATTQKGIGAAMATQAAQDRVGGILKRTSAFMNTVNAILGSQYQDITQFLRNQIDVNRFYSSAPGSLQGQASFISREELIDMAFGGTNSLIASAKNAGSNYAGLYESLVGIKKTYGSKSIVDDSAVLFQKWGDAQQFANGDVKKLTAYHDDLIAKYTLLIEDNKNNISPAELYVHEQTLKALVDAREGKVSDPNTMSAWDLANPFANRYDEATGQKVNYFGQVLQVVADDSKIASDVANGAVQIVRQVNGKWQYGEAVYPGTNAGGSQRIIKTGTGYAYGIVEGVPVMFVPNTPGLKSEAIKQQTMQLGYYYDLGNGNFQIKSTDGVWYAQNFDPISGKTMTSNDFRKSYIQTTSTATTAAESTGGQAAQFVTGTKFTPYDRSPITDDTGFLSADVDLDMKRIDRMYDPIAASKIKTNLVNDLASKVTDPNAASTLLTKYSTQINIQSTGTRLPEPSLPMVTSAPGGGMAALSSMPTNRIATANTFDRGSVPTTPKLPTVKPPAGAALDYFFRNTPISGTVGSVVSSVGGGGGAGPRVSPIKL